MFKLLIHLEEDFSAIEKMESF